MDKRKVLRLLEGIQIDTESSVTDLEEVRSMIGDNILRGEEDLIASLELDETDKGMVKVYIGKELHTIIHIDFFVDSDPIYDTLISEEKAEVKITLHVGC